MHWFCGFEHVAAQPWIHLFAGTATECEKRVCSGTFAVMPFGLMVVEYFRRVYFDDSIRFSLSVGGLLVAGALCLCLCEKCIPAKVSWMAGTIVWVVFLALVFTGKF